MNQNTTEDVTDEKKNDIIVNNSAEAIIEDEVASKVDTDFKGLFIYIISHQGGKGGSS